MGRIKKSIKDHPVIWGVCTFGLFEIGPTVEAYWALFSDEPLYKTVQGWVQQEGGRMSLPPLDFVQVVTLALPVVGVLLLVYIVHTARRAPVLPSGADDPDEATRAGDAEAAIVPSLVLRPSVISEKERKKMAVVIVKNGGSTGALQGCEGRLLAVYEYTDGTRKQRHDIAPTPLQWSPRHPKGEKGTLDINTEAQLNVVQRLFDGEDTAPKIMSAHADMTAQGRYELKTIRTHILSIEISARNAEPVTEEFELVMERRGVDSDSDGYAASDFPNWTFKSLGPPKPSASPS